MEQINLPQPLFKPQNLNLDFIFQKIYVVVKSIFYFITNPHTWTIIGIISVTASVIFITIIIFSLVRLIEMQHQDKLEINNEIEEALKREEEKNKTKNSKWLHILTLIESPDESNWRVAIIEADTILEEALKSRGVPGNTVAELLESIRGDGYSYLQNAWDAHLIRNQIAHKGTDFSLSKLESRRVMRMYQNFLEELKII